MNKEEIKHFKSLLRQGSLRHMNILLDDKFQKELQTIIEDYEKLQQENNELKERIEYLERSNNRREDIILEQRQETNNLETQQKEFIKYLELEKDYFVRGCSNVYEDSLGHTRLVNEDIFDEINDVLQKYREIIGVSDEKK